MRYTFDPRVFRVNRVFGQNDIPSRSRKVRDGFQHGLSLSETSGLTYNRSLP